MRLVDGLQEVAKKPTMAMADRDGGFRFGAYCIKSDRSYTVRQRMEIL